VYRKSAIIGIGESVYYKHGHSPHTGLQLTSTAISRSIADAGLQPSDIDGLVTFSDTTLRAHANLASWFGFGNLKFAANSMSGGGNVGHAAVAVADAAVCAGYASNVIVYRGINQGREGRFGRVEHGRFDRASSTPSASRPLYRDLVVSGEHAYDIPYGGGAPVVWNALRSMKFMHKYGISQDQLAEIALADYAHAQRNPRAVMYGRPLTREQYHNSRWIAEPFHLYDCCQENDGACAVVVSSAERALDGPAKPAFILAAAIGMEAKGGLWAYNDSAWPNGRLRSVGEQLWERSGVGPSDVRVAQFYENFSGTTMQAIADIGFCPPEGVGDFIADGALHWPNGRLPMNTSGGNIGEAYIHGFQLVVEGVRQIRGASTCQVSDAELSLVVGGPGTPPSSALLLSNRI
jgi:acetyl-CoA acetyltransferase